MLYPFIHIACKGHQEIWFSSGLASATHFQLSGDWRMRLVCRIAVALVVPWILQTVGLCMTMLYYHAHVITLYIGRLIVVERRLLPGQAPQNSFFKVHVARACYIATVLVNEAGLWEIHFTQFWNSQLHLFKSYRLCWMNLSWCQALSFTQIWRFNNRPKQPYALRLGFMGGCLKEFQRLQVTPGWLLYLSLF